MLCNVIILTSTWPVQYPILRKAMYCTATSIFLTQIFHNVGTKQRIISTIQRDNRPKHLALTLNIQQTYPQAAHRT